MSIRIVYVATKEEIRNSLRTFNKDIRVRAENLDLARKLFVETTYWVYDPISENWGPSKFVGFRNMTYETYLLARQNETVGDRFDGKATRVRIEHILRKAYSYDSGLLDKLILWAQASMGKGAVCGKSIDKRRLISL